MARAVEYPELRARGQTHDDWRGLNEQNRKQEVPRNGGRAAWNAMVEAGGVEFDDQPGGSRQQGERDDGCDACGRWRRIVALFGEAAAPIGFRLVDPAMSRGAVRTRCIVGGIVLVHRTRAPGAARLARLRRRRPARTQPHLPQCEGKRRDDADEPPAKEHHSPSMWQPPAGVNAIHGARRVPPSTHQRPAPTSCGSARTGTCVSASTR